MDEKQDTEAQIPNAEGDKDTKESILIGVCGGIAAYKIPSLVSLLVQQGYRVRVVLSQAAARFVSRKTLETLSGQRVFTDLWERGGLPPHSPVLHIALVEEADVFLLAPASYNWIGQAAGGLAPDLLGTLYAAWPIAEKPLLFAPAMNPSMWQQPALQRNISLLQQDGCQLIEPESGFLACRAEGQGRMVEAESLFFRLQAALRRRRLAQQGAQNIHGTQAAGCAAAGLPLRGLKILLTVGGTREALDPVRYLSNRSSGRTGLALACAARDLGAEVTAITAIEELRRSADTADPVGLGRLSRGYLLFQELFGIRLLACDSAREMARHAAESFGGCDWALAVAAVCDFRPLEESRQKIKKLPGQTRYSLELQQNPDILAHWGQHKQEGQRVLGFALESAAEDVPESAREKAERGHALEKLYSKKADAIVLNRPANLERETAQAEVFFCNDAPSSGDSWPGQLLPQQSKRDFAQALLLLLVERWRHKPLP